MKVHSVYGGPGTGKSSELIRRVNRLRSLGVPPERIAFISFTRAATEEALSRMSGDGYMISTVHAMCYRKLGLKRPVVVNDSKLTKFFDELGIEYTGGSLDLDNAFSGTQSEGNEYLTVLSLARSRMINPMDLYDNVGETGTMSQFAMFMRAYDAWKDSYGFLDFGDMLEAAIHAKIGADYDVLFVDEAQDLSKMQWAVIRSLIQNGETKEIHIALDDDQSLHVWNGADPLGAVEFESDFDASRVVLSKSHRLPKAVHRLAMNLINGIENRVYKNFGCRDDEGSVSQIGWLPDIEPKSMILARTNMLVLGLEKELIERRIPYEKLGSRGHGAWKTQTAMALKVWNKYESGVPINEVDEAVLHRAITSDARAKMQHNGVTSILSEDWRDCIVCSDRMVDFYEDVYDKINDDISIRLGTVHASKGMESDNVYLDTETTPRVTESAENDPDSEIRVKYVGITRARHNLILIGES